MIKLERNTEQQIRTWLAQGVPVEDISDATGVPEADIIQLQGEVSHAYTLGLDKNARDDVVVQWYTSGVPILDIEIGLRTSPATIYRILRRYKIPLRRVHADGGQLDLKMAQYVRKLEQAAGDERVTQLHKELGWVT